MWMDFVLDTITDCPPTSRELDSPSTPPRRRTLLVALASATALHGLSSALIAALLPTLQNHYPGRATGTWITSAFFLAAALAAPTGGRLADLFGARRVAVSGLVLVAVGSALAALAPAPAWLVVARAITGVGTAVQYPAALGLLRRHSSVTNATTGLAFIAVASEVAFAAAPSLGTAVMQWAGWRVAIAMPSLFAVVAAILMLVGTSRERAAWAGWRRLLVTLDLPGMATFCAAVIVVVTFLITMPQPHWTLLVAFPVLVAVLWVWERRFAPVPFLAPRVVTDRDLVLTLGRTLLFYCCFYVVFYALPVWLAAHAVDASQIALAMLPLPVAVVGTCLIARRVVRRAGAHVALGIGAFGLLLAAALPLVPNVPELQIAVGVAALLAVPAGLVNVANQRVLLYFAPVTHIASVGGMYRIAQFVGGGIAAAVLHLTDADDVLPKLSAVTAAGAAILIVTSVIGVVRNRRSLTRTGRHRKIPREECFGDESMSAAGEADVGQAVPPAPA
ncbi:MFS transporter [Kutzneria sp. CA-103260]|uniref:MFS transporter n=1 Tax=Kutzneria sp. CA-103260 TaxID=2802641 RepID=UPI001BA6C223|nr:MFS transporter [Kutzneria sp. CA-103260]QUQ67144.1 Putative multidrug resistance protein MdtD [Kutzneria sp. CA-103260]